MEAFAAQSADPCAMKIASDIVSPVLVELRNIAQDLKPEITANSIAFVMYGLTCLADSVSGFIKNSEEHGLRLRRCRDILDAFYSATDQTRTVALRIRTHVTSSSIELRRLRAVTRIIRDDRAKALQELKLVSTAQMNLPQDVLTDLVDAKAAYEKVIALCQKILRKRGRKRFAVRVCACIGLLLAATALAIMAIFAAPCAIALTTKLMVAGATSAATAHSTSGTALAFSSLIVGGTGTATTSSLAITGLQQLYQMVEDARKQKKHLYTAQGKAEGIIVDILKLQEKVDRIQHDIRSIADVTEVVQRWGSLQSLSDLETKEFEEEVSKQLQELPKLKKECQNLIDKVMEAYDYFRHKITDKAAPQKPRKFYESRKFCH